MQNVWPYFSFLLGAIFALVLQWISYRLSFKKDQRKEYWIRKLNSYQDFYHHTTQLIDLLNSNISIPQNVYWQSISSARKAAYDAIFYDKTHPERTSKMKDITLDTIQLLLYRIEGHEKTTEECTTDKLQELTKQIEDIQASFYEEEKLLSKEDN